MNKKYPFKFLDAYTREDADIFFGREAEINALYQMVFETDLLLVYGASGTGKTSLIQCGLASRFQSHDWLALPIRRGENINASFEKALVKAGGILDATESTEDWLDADFSREDMSPIATRLSPLARRLKAIYLQHFRPIYFIFDQFEELYILGSKEEQQVFIETIQELLQVEQPVKVIISIREEYLGHLYEFERQVPELLRKKLRVEPMHLDKVQKVVKGIGQFPDSIVALKLGEEEQIGEAIFQKIRGRERTLSIQLPYLQVFLDKLYLNETEDETRTSNAVFRMESIKATGDIGDVLRNFLDEQVLKIAQQQQMEPAGVWTVLSPFVTLDGTKEPLSIQQLQDRIADIPTADIVAVVQSLGKNRILRYNDQEELYELMHDALAEQVHAQRSDEEIALLEVKRLIRTQTTLNTETQEYFSAKQLDVIGPYLQKLVLTPEEWAYVKNSEKAVRQKKMQQLRRLWLLGVTAFISILIMTLLTIRSNSTADDLAVALDEVNSMRKVAEKNLEKATKLIDAFYFYADRFALASGQYFYFIDKNGKSVDKLGQWERAEQFDRFGFAKVVKDGKQYLIDTFGQKYLAAYSLQDLKAETEALYLLGYELKVFPKEILMAKGLKNLVLENPVAAPQEGFIIPTNIGQLQGLEFLSIRGFPNLKILPASIGELSKLRHLDLSYNGLVDLPEQIGLLKELRYLDLERNELRFLPEEIGGLKTLEYLNLVDNNLEAFPAILSELSELKSLKIGGNSIKSIPARLGQLHKLALLDFTYGEPSLEAVDLRSICLAFQDYPRDIVLTDQNVKLARTDAELIIKTGFPSLPAEIGQLKSLISLTTMRHFYEPFPSSKRFTIHPEIKKLKRLKSLIIRRQLDSFPLNLVQIESLEILVLFECKLNYIPDAIERLHNLKTLNLALNDIERLPKEIGSLKNLTSLNLFRNKISSLPEEIGNLQKLVSLDINYNDLGGMPSSLGKLRNLESLDLSGNISLDLKSVFNALRNFGKEIKIIPWDTHRNIRESENELIINLAFRNEIPNEIGLMRSLTHLEITQAKRSAQYTRKETQEEVQKFNEEVLSSQKPKTFNLPNGIWKLRKLRNLKLGRINHLDPRLGNLKYLEQLEWFGNVSIPNSLGTLKNLRHLSFSVDKDQILPATLSKLKRLEHLKIVGVLDPIVPSVISSLDEMKHLEIEIEDHQAITSKFRKLKSLKTLNIDIKKKWLIPQELQDSLEVWLPNTQVSIR